MKILISFIFLLLQSQIYSQVLKDIHYEYVEVEGNSVIFAGYENSNNLKIEFISKKYIDGFNIFKFRVNNFGTYKIFFIQQDLSSGSSKNITKIIEYKKSKKIDKKTSDREIFTPSKPQEYLSQNINLSQNDKSIYEIVIKEDDLSNLSKDYSAKEYFGVAQKLEISEDFNLVLKAIDLYEFIFENYSYSEFSDRAKKRYLVLKNKFIDMR